MNLSAGIWRGASCSKLGGFFLCNIMTIMKKLAKKFFPNFIKRENITALSMIVAIGGISSVLAFGGATLARYEGLQAKKEMRHSAYEDEFRQLSGITTNIQPVEDPTANWKLFESQKYGFSIKYPNGWQEPVETSATPGSNYLSLIEFKNGSEKNGKESFEIFVYSSAKFPGPLGTDNLKKKNESVDPKDCSHFDDITLGEEGYSAKEINVTADDPCWEETFFYSLTKKGYTFNIVPHFGSGYDIKNYDEKIDLVKIFPEFYDISSTLNFKKQESAVQFSKQAIQKVVGPPKVKYVAGRACPNKHDHPSYSKKHKGKHMDEDCCPDPDEWPNPTCAYSGGALGLMRSGP